MSKDPNKQMCLWSYKTAIQVVVQCNPLKSSFATTTNAGASEVEQSKDGTISPSPQLMQQATDVRPVLFSGAASSCCDEDSFLVKGSIVTNLTDATTTIYLCMHANY